MNLNLRRLLSRTIIRNLDLGFGESIKVGAALFYIAYKRLDNINWDAI